jgi:SOS-response transcriptional repressor LexA
VKDLTMRQCEVLSFIKIFIKNKGYSPSVRDLATEFGFSPKAAFDHLIALRKKGYITWVPNTARTISIIKKGMAMPNKKALSVFGRALHLIHREPFGCTLHISRSPTESDSRENILSRFIFVKDHH